MGFILRILFSGLIVFVPSHDGKELTVLLLNVAHGHHLSDGSKLSQHTPLLLARAGACSGDCPTRDSAIAQYVFADQSSTTAQDSLEAAVTGGGGGGAWQLSSSDLTLAKGSTTDPDLPALVLRNNVRGSSGGVPQMIPTTSTERGDFTWIADLSQICGSGCTLDPAIYDTQPPATVAARLHLRSGNVFTYSVARIGSNVTPVHFSRLDGTGSDAAYTQAIATWVGAEIDVSGDSIAIDESKFNGDPGRSMTLTPDANGLVDVAVINLPSFVPPASASNDAPQVGKHFEMYYDLLGTPPAAEARLVPRPGAAAGAPSYPTVTWSSVHPSSVLWSDLLNAIRLNAGRSAYDRILCPPAEGQTP